jgi:hypothetical protein
MSLHDLLPRSRCPLQDIRVRGLTSGPHLVKVTAHATLRRDMGYVRAFIGHPILKSAAAWTLLIDSSRRYLLGDHHAVLKERMSLRHPGSRLGAICWPSGCYDFDMMKLVSNV